MPLKLRNNSLIEKRSSMQGFTLVEMLMTVLLFAIILGACYLILLSGVDSWHINSTKVEVQQEARKAAEWMRQELIQSGSSTVTNVPVDGNWYTTITFKTATGISGGSISWSSNTIQYLLGSGATANRLIRRSGGVDTVLAQSIQTLQFRRQSSSVVELNIQAQKSTPKGRALTSTTNFKIKMRN